MEKGGKKVNMFEDDKNLIDLNRYIQDKNIRGVHCEFKEFCRAYRYTPIDTVAPDIIISKEKYKELYFIIIYHRQNKEEITLNETEFNALKDMFLKGNYPKY